MNENDSTVLTQEEKTMGMLCHLLGFAGFVIPFGNIIGPLVLWLVKKDSSPFIDLHGKESLNFQISITIYASISSLLIFILIGFPMLIAVAIFAIVCMIKAAIKANDGQIYRYPATIRFIK